MTYRTIASQGTGEIRSGDSRFRCLLVRVEDEMSARSVIDGVRRDHWDARHHCSAYVLGATRDLERSHDDGEPPGTGGMPILQVLRGHELSDVVAVVTRWFGGTLLGAGNLARAYADAVSAALEETALVDRVEQHLYDVAVDLAAVGRLEHELRSRGTRVVDTDYTDVATLRIAVPEQARDVAEEIVAELTGGEARLVARGSTWVDVPV